MIYHCPKCQTFYTAFNVPKKVRFGKKQKICCNIPVIPVSPLLALRLHKKIQRKNGGK